MSTLTLHTLRRAYMASVLLLLRFLPLGIASCAIVPLYWTLPRILGLQAAVPAAVAEGGARTLGTSARLQQAHRLPPSGPLLSRIVLRGTGKTGVRN